MSKAGGLEFTSLPATFYTVITANNNVKLSDKSATNFSIWQNRLQYYEDVAGHDRNLAIVKGIEELAAEKRCSTAQLALAWLLARGDDIVPIAGTKRRSYLEQNVGAVEVKLSANDLSRLDRAAPRGAASGARYPQEAMQRVNI